MADRVSHFNNGSLYDMRIDEAHREFFPGELKPHGFRAMSHWREEHGTDRAWLSCSCPRCEAHRGHDVQAIARRKAEFADIVYALEDEYVHGPPVTDSPELWAEWPKEET